MQGSFATTIEALSDHPDVHKASGIGEERTLILDMLEEMSANPASVDGCDACDVAGLISHLIRQGHHRREFGQ